MASKARPELRVSRAVSLLSSLVGSVGFLAVAPHITTAYGVAFAGLFFCSLYFEHIGRHVIPRWVLNVLSLAVLGLNFTRLSLSDPVIPILDALVVLLGIKFIEQKKFRDYMQICAIAVFLLAGSALVTLGMMFLLYFGLLLVLLSLTIVFLAYLSQGEDLKLPARVVTRIAVKSLLIPAAALPLGALIFVILPRSDYPFLNFLNVGQGAATGFSETVRLGEVSEIQEDEHVIFRVQMAKVDEGLLYWRGLVLDHFDGAGWTSSGRKEVKSGGAESGLDVVEQTVYLEPYGNRYLFGLDIPVSMSGLRSMTARTDHTFTLGRGIHRRVKYQVRSTLRKAIPETVADRDHYLQLPPGLSSEIADLARAKALQGDDKAAARSLTEFLRKAGFAYTLKNLPLSETPLEEFLFRRREGNCEYFASALAVLLRSAGIPSRLIGGYRGGHYNEMGEYYLVRQSNAHVWVEAYIGGTGWVRLDPTPASGAVDPYGGRSLSARARLMADAVNYYWNAVVLPYDLERQRSFYRQVRAGITRPDLTFLKDLRGSAVPLLWICIGVAAAIGARALLKRREPIEKRVVRQFLKALNRSGYPRAPSEGLEELVSRIQDGRLKEQAQRFVKEFQNLYYRDRNLKRDDVVRLREIVRDL